MVNLSIAIYLYKTAPIPKETPKPLPLATEMEEIPTETPRIDTVEEKVIADAIEIGDDEEEIQIRKFTKFCVSYQTGDGFTILYSKL